MANSNTVAGVGARGVGTGSAERKDETPMTDNARHDNHLGV